MINTAFTWSLATALNLALSILPDPDPSTLAVLNSSASYFRSLYSPLNYFLPVGSMFIVLGVIFTVEASILSYYVTRKVVTFITLNFVRI